MLSVGFYLICFLVVLFDVVFLIWTLGCGFDFGFVSLGVCLWLFGLFGVRLCVCCVDVDLRGLWRC